MEADSHNCRQSGKVQVSELCFLVPTALEPARRGVEVMIRL